MEAEGARAMHSSQLGDPLLAPPGGETRGPWLQLGRGADGHRPVSPGGRLGEHLLRAVL